MKCSKALATIDAQACTEQRCILPRNPREKRLLTRRCSAGALTRLYPGLYMHPQYLAQLNPFERKMHLVRALHLLHKQWVFAGSTAACIHDLQIPYMALGSKIHIASPSKPHHNDCAQLQRIHNPNAEWDFVNGVPVTSLTRTAVDGVNTMEDCCAITVLDSCLRAGVSEEDLLAACSLPNGNVNLLRAMLPYTTIASENGGEAYTHAVITFRLGFARPRQQVEIVDPLTRRIYRTDYYWETEDGLIIVGELDGEQKYTDPSMTRGRSVSEVIDAEREREAALRRAGVDVIVRFTFSDVLNGESLRRKTQTGSRTSRVAYRHPQLRSGQRLPPGSPLRKRRQLGHTKCPKLRRE